MLVLRAVEGIEDSRVKRSTLSSVSGSAQRDSYLVA